MYDDEGGVAANGEWRNDPDRRRAAAEQYESQSAALREAIPHLEAAYKALCGLRTDDDPRSSMIQRVRRDVWSALDYARRIDTGPPTDTYIGNMAALGEGWTRH